MSFADRNLRGIQNHWQDMLHMDLENIELNAFTKCHNEFVNAFSISEPRESSHHERDPEATHSLKETEAGQ